MITSFIANARVTKLKSHDHIYNKAISAPKLLKGSHKK